MPGRRWRVSLADQAWRDLEDILAWTATTFGARQSRTYENTIAAAIAALAAGPDTPGARRRDEIRPGLFSLHVARARRRGRHFLFFRASPADQRTIYVMRILHDSMDFARHFADDG